MDNCHLNVSVVLCCITFGRLHIHKWKVCTISGPFTRRLTQMYSSIKSEFSRPFFGQLPPKCVCSTLLYYYIWKIAHHKWKVCTISGPFTCCLTQMYSSIKSEFSRRFFGQLPPKCVPSTLLYYIWKIAYTQMESLHNFRAIYSLFDLNV